MDLVTFTEEILNGKLYFLCSVGFDVFISLFFAAQQTRFSTPRGKVRRLKKAWVRFPEHSIQNFPIFYYLQLDTNPFKKRQYFL